MRMEEIKPIKSLTGAVLESIEARKQISPLEYRLVNLEKKQPELEKGMRGISWQMNTCVGFTRETTADITAMKERLVSQAEEITNLKAALGAQQVELLAVKKRLDAFAVWASKQEREAMSKSDDLSIHGTTR